MVWRLVRIHCGQTGIVRVEQVVEVVCVLFVPVHRRPVGISARCDFCERDVPIEKVHGQLVDWDEWNHAAGLAVLERQVGMELTPTNEQQRFASLLTSIDEATRINRIDCTRGLVVGVLVGALLGGIAGNTFIPRMQLGVDQLGAVFLGVFAGIAIGSVGGAVTALVWQRWFWPVSRLKTVYQQYRISPALMDELGVDLCPRIRRAVRRFRNETAFAPSIMPHRNL